MFLIKRGALSYSRNSGLPVTQHWGINLVALFILLRVRNMMKSLLYPWKPYFFNFPTVTHIVTPSLPHPSPPLDGETSPSEGSSQNSYVATDGIRNTYSERDTTVVIYFYYIILFEMLWKSPPHSGLINSRSILLIWSKKNLLLPCSWPRGFPWS